MGSESIASCDRVGALNCSIVTAQAGTAPNAAAMGALPPLEAGSLPQLAGPAPASLHHAMPPPAPVGPNPLSPPGLPPGQPLPSPSLPTLSGGAVSYAGVTPMPGTLPAPMALPHSQQLQQVCMLTRLISWVVDIQCSEFRLWLSVDRKRASHTFKIA